VCAGTGISTLLVCVCVCEGMLPVDVAEMVMDDSCCDVETSSRDRVPIVRVDDPDYSGSRYSKMVSHPCCWTPARMTWQRRLFVVAGSIALLTAVALLALLVFLVVTRP